MKLSDLITDPKDGRISHTKVWSNIGMLALTVSYVYRAFYGGFADMEMETLIYGALVASPNLFGKYMSMRFGIQPKQEKEETNG